MSSATVTADDGAFASRLLKASLIAGNIIMTLFFGITPSPVINVRSFQTHEDCSAAVKEDKTDSQRNDDLR